MLTVIPTAARVSHFIKALTFLYKGHQLLNQVFFFLSHDLNGISRKRKISLSSETLKDSAYYPLHTRTS